MLRKWTHVSIFDNMWRGGNLLAINDLFTSVPFHELWREWWSETYYRSTFYGIFLGLLEINSSHYVAHYIHSIPKVYLEIRLRICPITHAPSISLCSMYCMWNDMARLAVVHFRGNTAVAMDRRVWLLLVEALQRVSFPPAVNSLASWRQEPW